MADLLLLETGDKVLREDGDPISLTGNLINTFQNFMAVRTNGGITVGDRVASALAGIGGLPTHSAIALEDLFAAVDDPTGTPVTKKMSGTDLKTLTCSNVVVQVFDIAGSGTYTPTAGMRKVLGIAVGGGGGGAGGINTDSAGGGGGGGGTCIRLMTAAQIGASKAYVVGAQGAATSAGTATTLDAAGALLNAGGGGAGTAGTTSTTVGVSTAGGAGGTAANGDLNIPGEPGGRGMIFSGSSGYGGKGGSSVFGFGGATTAENTAGNAPAAPFGAGGSGGHASATQDRVGAHGEDGLLLMIEFI